MEQRKQTQNAAPAPSEQPQSAELSLEEAADILNVSPIYLSGLLDSKAIPSSGAGRLRRVPLIDLIAYKRKRDAERRAALDELTAMSQEFGPYTGD